MLCPELTVCLVAHCYCILDSSCPEHGTLFTAVMQHSELACLAMLGRMFQKILKLT